MIERQKLLREAKFIGIAQNMLLQRVAYNNRDYLLGDEFTRLLFKQEDYAENFYFSLGEAFPNFNITLKRGEGNRYNFYLHRYETHYLTRLAPGELTLEDADRSLDEIRMNKISKIDDIDRMVRDGLRVSNISSAGGHIQIADSFDEEPPPPYNDCLIGDENTILVQAQHTTVVPKKKCLII